MSKHFHFDVVAGKMAGRGKKDPNPKKKTKRNSEKKLTSLSSK